MAARESYDQERIIRKSETHDDPTEVIRRTDVIESEPRRDVHHAEAVVVDRSVPSYGLEEDAVREDVSVDNVVARRALIDRVASVIWFVVGLLEAIIGLRVVFLLLNANESSAFVRFIYNFSDPFVRPFQGIFSNPSSDGSVLDSGAIVAMIIYALATWALVRLVWLLLDRPDTGASRTVSQTRRDRY